MVHLVSNMHASADSFSAGSVDDLNTENVLAVVDNSQLGNPDVRRSLQHCLVGLEIIELCSIRMYLSCDVALSQSCDYGDWNWNWSWHEVGGHWGSVCRRS